MLEILLTLKTLGTLKIEGPRLKPFKPNGKSASGVAALFLRKSTRFHDEKM